MHECFIFDDSYSSGLRNKSNWASTTQLFFLPLQIIVITLHLSALDNGYASFQASYQLLLSCVWILDRLNSPMRNSPVTSPLFSTKLFLFGAGYSNAKKSQYKLFLQFCSFVAEKLFEKAENSWGWSFFVVVWNEMINEISRNWRCDFAR